MNLRRCNSIACRGGSLAGKQPVQIPWLTLISLFPTLRSMAVNGKQSFRSPDAFPKPFANFGNEMEDPSSSPVRRDDCVLF